MPTSCRTTPFSRAAEGYRAVRSAVLFELALAEQQELAISGQAPGPREQAIVLMVVSGAAGEGKTTTTANLAAAFAEAGSSVLAINGDFRRPALHRQFGVPDVPGAILDTGIPGCTWSPAWRSSRRPRPPKWWKRNGG